MQIREEMAQRYWVLSRQWRGDSRFGSINVGEMLTGVADLAGSLNNIGWQRAEARAASLLDQVINNKRSRKSKDTHNVVAFTRPLQKSQIRGRKADYIIYDDIQTQVG